MSFISCLSYLFHRTILHIFKGANQSNAVDNFDQAQKLTYHCFNKKSHDTTQNVALLQVLVQLRDLSEMIAVKAVVALFAFYRVRLLPSDDILSLVTVCSVCRKWYEFFSSRRFNRRKIRYNFKMTVSSVVGLSRFLGSVAPTPD